MTGYSPRFRKEKRGGSEIGGNSDGSAGSLSGCLGVEDAQICLCDNLLRDDLSLSSWLCARRSRLSERCFRYAHLIMDLPIVCL